MFKVGDKVKIIGSLDPHDSENDVVVGMTGVVDSLDNDYDALVKLDGWFGGHGDALNQWYLRNESIELVNDFVND